MFTINIYLKFALIAVFLFGGVALAFAYSFWYALPLILIGLGLLVSYILLGTVQSAAMKIQTGDFEASEKKLDLTLNPKWLYKTNRSYYFLLKGTFAGQRNNFEEAEKWFNVSKQIGLPSDNEKAMVQLQLANISAAKGKWNQAKIQFREVKKLKVSEVQLKDQIKQFEKALTNRGQMKHMRQGKGMQQQMKGSRRVKR
jgi:tetratricopeptide (TPR) repeat protein